MPYVINGERIRELRHQSGLTQSGLAKRIECYQPYLCNLESGKSDDVLASRLAVIAKVFGLPIESLLKWRSDD